MSIILKVGTPLISKNVAQASNGVIVDIRKDYRLRPIYVVEHPECVGEYIESTLRELFYLEETGVVTK